MVRGSRPPYRVKPCRRPCNTYRRAGGTAGAAPHPGGAGASTCPDPEREAAGTAAACGDGGLATHPDSAPPDPSAFLRRPGMPPNHTAERDMRDAAAVRRRFRHRFAGPEGTGVFAPMPSRGACRRPGAVPRTMPGRTAGSPGRDMVQCGLGAPNPPAPPAPPYIWGVGHGRGREGAPAGPPAGPGIRSGRGTEPAPPGRPHRIPAATIVPAAFIRPAGPDWAYPARIKTPAIPAMDAGHAPVYNRTTAPRGRPPPAIAS